MTAVSITTHDDLPPEAQRVDQGLDESNLAAAPLHEVRPLSCFARDEAGQVIGGAVGRWWGDCCELQQLWVDEAHRRQGIGARLIGAFEALAATHGCSTFYLETFNFQAPALYRSLGYGVAHEHAVYPHGIVKFLMVKRVGGAGNVIRTLGPGDLGDLRAMLGMFGTAFDDREAYVGSQPDDAYLRKLLSSETFIGIVACAGAEVIGGLAGYVLPKFEQARSEFYIYDLAVDARYRRRGVATAMIEELKRVVAERGVYVVFVQADHGDDPAVALYTKLGMREDVMHFDISPNPGSA